MTISSDPSHPDAEVGSFDLTVLAVGSGLEARKTLNLTVELLDVTGVVIDPLGTPLAGISVLASGAGSASTVGPVRQMRLSVVQSVGLEGLGGG